MKRIFLLHIPVHVYFGFFYLQFNIILHSIPCTYFDEILASPQPIYQDNGRETSPQLKSLKAFFIKQALVSIYRGVLAAPSMTTVLHVDHQWYLFFYYELLSII